jgi:transposase
MLPDAVLCSSKLTYARLSAERGRKDHGPESYSVRLCRNTECRRILWNRDVNAAINILRLFLDWVEGRSKPPEFCRAGQ